MKLTELSTKKALNKAYRLVKPKPEQVKTFKAGLITLLGQIEDKESEENVKIHLIDFLKNTFYHPDYLIATKGKTDFVINTGKDANTSAGVMFEVKKPTNKADMITRQNLNAKAMHKLLLYYLRERLKHNNNLTHLVITNIYDWFIFDAQDFERLFFKNTQLKKDYEAWQQGQKTSTNTNLFYKEIAKPFIAQLEEEITFTYFNLKDFEKPLRNASKAADSEFISLLKILSPVHLLKLPFTNDSNSLDKRFYAALLHLIGQEEVKKGNKNLIRWKPAGKHNQDSLLENIYVDLSYIIHNPSIQPLQRQTLQDPILKGKVLFCRDFYVVLNHKTEKIMLADFGMGLTEAAFAPIAQVNPKVFLFNARPK
ncbi:DUF7149 domain-containing protein [Adhaeribacter soli]|uniref:Class I SAM-dependent DNA methyltransferase n=1 Tax=Adhaeribacter soli TaxID=2607655 RepID=A0A5N1IXZ5_9BACT|nr:hypothetical protein [Adhaeribacter soli]KAA9338797.1 hypothetical protein F0P94_08345 [Adhaeribacter soli]